MREREDGFYWVKFATLDWTVAEYYRGSWQVICDDVDYYDEDMCTIGDRVARRSDDPNIPPEEEDNGKFTFPGKVKVEPKQEWELLEESLKVLKWGDMHHFSRLVPNFTWEDQPVFVDAAGNLHTIGGVRCDS